MLRSILNSLIIRPVRLVGLVIAATVLISGCASPVRHQVMVFHDWPTNLDQRTFRLAKGGADADADDLKRRTWEKIIRKELIAGGFVPSESPALEISFNFQTRDRKVRRRYPYFTPYYSFGRSFRRGGFSISGPLWGWGWHGPSYPVVSSVYEHELNITMKELRSSQPTKVFEGSSVTRNNEGPAIQALPLLTRSILKNFPGESGIVRTVDFEPAEQRK